MVHDYVLGRRGSPKLTTGLFVGPKAMGQM